MTHRSKSDLKPEHNHETMKFTIHIVEAVNLTLDSPRSQRTRCVRSRPAELPKKPTPLASSRRCLCTLLATLPVDPGDGFESLVKQWPDVGSPRLKVARKTGGCARVPPYRFRSVESEKFLSQLGIAERPIDHLHKMVKGNFRRKSGLNNRWAPRLVIRLEVIQEGIGLCSGQPQRDKAEGDWLTN
jgi:hypothetical protein